MVYFPMIMSHTDGLFKEYERITTNLEYDKFCGKEDMTKRKLLAEILELKMETFIDGECRLVN